MVLFNANAVARVRSKSAYSSMFKSAASPPCGGDLCVLLQCVRLFRLLVAAAIYILRFYTLLCKDREKMIPHHLSRLLLLLHN